ncbi:MAG: MOSC domain-containing protein [Planctomycetota bacterium]
MHVAAIISYPLKSAAGQSRQCSTITPAGLPDDRRWMVVDADAVFLTQRQVPLLATVSVVETTDQLICRHRSCPDLLLSLSEVSSQLSVRCWQTTMRASDAGALAAAWFTALLGRRCRLVRLDQAQPVSARWYPDGATTAFSDGFPLTIISQASLDALNHRLAVPVPMARFRPNLVIADCEPHAEDDWRRIAIGALEIDLCKPCPRCQVTTIDQDRGQRVDAEPLATLSSYRRSELGVCFGQNAVARGPGQLAVGAAVTVVA